LVAKESSIGPRSRAITASNQDDLFHLFDPQPEPSGEGKPAADMRRYPPAKITLRESVLTPSCYWQG